MRPDRSTRFGVRNVLGWGLIALALLAFAAPAEARSHRHAHGHAAHALGARASSPAAHRRPADAAIALVRGGRGRPRAQAVPQPLDSKAAALDRAPAGLTLTFGAPLPGHGVNSRFGLRQLSFEPRARQHDGVDIAAPSGEAVHAAAMGFVRRTGLSESYGHFVEVAHADGVSTFYAHLVRGSKLKAGAFVAPGAVLGFVGSTGHSTGPHLHFEVRRDGAPLNPQLFLGRRFAGREDLPSAPARLVRAGGAARDASAKAWRAWAALHVRRGSARG
jgi:murein DD-endopeptidase MepM/ murein hydrolase activator NlpD